MGTKNVKKVKSKAKEPKAKCPICKDAFDPKSKRQKICPKPACRKQNTNNYMREYMRKRAAAQKAALSSKEQGKVTSPGKRTPANRKAKRDISKMNRALKSKLRQAQKALNKASAALEEALAQS